MFGGIKLSFVWWVVGISMSPNGFVYLNTLSPVGFGPFRKYGLVGRRMSLEAGFDSLKTCAISSCPACLFPTILYAAMCPGYM